MHAQAFKVTCPYQVQVECNMEQLLQATKIALWPTLPQRRRLGYEVTS